MLKPVIEDEHVGGVMFDRGPRPADAVLVRYADDPPTDASDQLLLVAFAAANRAVPAQNDRRSQSVRRKTANHIDDDRRLSRPADGQIPDADDRSLHAGHADPRVESGVAGADDRTVNAGHSGQYSTHRPRPDRSALPDHASMKALQRHQLRAAGASPTGIPSECYRIAARSTCFVSGPVSASIPPARIGADARAGISAPFLWKLWVMSKPVTLRRQRRNAVPGSRKRHGESFGLPRRRACWGVIVCAAAAAGAPATPLQDPPQDVVSPPIIAVLFEGVERTSEAYLREIVQVRVGEPLNTDALDRDVARLVRTGRFDSVRYETRPEGGGVTVVFTLAERPVLKSIRFQGNSKIPDRDLKGKVPLKVGDPIDPDAVNEGLEAIAALYREKSFGQVEVTVEREDLAEGRLTYRIEEGPQIKVRKILFEGRASLSERELMKQIQTRTAFWFFRAGTLDPPQLEADVANLQRYYREQGFLDAKVTHRVENLEKEGDRRIVFTIEEGTRYRIESLRFEGNTVFSTEELQSLIRSREGAYVIQPILEADRTLIEKRYGEIGYIERNVEAVRVFSESPGQVLVTFRIVEGGQFRVGQIVVRGNTQTKDKVVLREFRLFPPDDLWNLTEARDAETRLRQTQIFQSARILPVGDEPGVRDALIDVQEADRVGDLIFGFGVTSNNGLVGQFAIDFKNFDISDTPKSFGEFFRLQAFQGAGQRMRIEAQPGTEVSRFRIDFTEPYLLDAPLRFDTGFFLFERGRDGYDEGRVGTYVSFGKRLERGLLKGWTGEIAFRLEDVEVDNVDLLAARDIRDVEGSNLLTSVKGALVLDRTDNRFIPSRGDRWRFSVEQFGILGGDHVFTELRTGYVRHFPVYTDLLDRKHVFSLRGDTAVLVGDTPVFERLYAGGIGSLRGFEYRGVGPREGLDDNPVGGDFMLLFGAEYTFPIYGESLRGVLFTDMGTVEESVSIRDWRASVGVGVRLTLDFLGPVPIEFDLAAPVLKGPDDEEQVFSFFVGTSFF